MAADAAPNGAAAKRKSSKDSKASKGPLPPTISNLTQLNETQKSAKPSSPQTVVSNNSHSSSSTSRPSSRGSSKASSHGGSSRGSRTSRSSRGSPMQLTDQDLNIVTSSAGLSRRRLSSRNPGEAQNFATLSEEEAFLRVLDLLERNDEYNSLISDSDEASSFDEGEAFESETDSEEFSDFNVDERPLADWELEAAWHELQNRRLPCMEACRCIIQAVTRLHASEPNVVYIPAPEQGARMVVVGDIHGHFSDLVHIFKEHGEPQSGPGGVKYLFNGDFVDRGAWGPEVLLAIYCLKIKCPDCIFLNRGNHEDQQQNLKPDNGFVHSHCIRAFGEEAQGIYYLCKESFKVLPLCHVVGKDVAVIHGGLPLDPGIRLADINAIDRHRAVPVRQCCVLGYPRWQSVVAARDLVTEDGEEVPAGAKGKLVERVGKARQASVKFEGYDEEVTVTLAGCPDMEQDVEMVYKDAEEREQHKLNRLFVALLWSDPVASKTQVGPSKRGAGSCFDAKVTQDFLRVNKLSLMLRSHEKRNDGYQEEHRSAKLGLMSATVFSASNYPSGAGAPCGNKAAVVVFRCPKDGQTLASSLSLTTPWRNNYNDTAYHEFRMSDEMKARFQQIQVQQTVGPRARALAKLRELIYCSRPKLLTLWQRLDSQGQGVVPVAEWAKAMRSCVVPDDEFPWEWLKPFMLRDASSEAFNYAAYLTQYENALSRKLADQWHSGAVIMMANNVKNQQEAEEAWNEIDRNGDGKLSYQELRPLLKSSALSDANLEEDRVYSVLSKIDKDRTGFVCKDEFMRAVVRSLEFQRLLQRTEEGGGARSEGGDFSSPETSPQRYGAKSSKRRWRNRKLRKELAKWDEEDVAHCWAATQGAVRALAATSGCAWSVFQVLDSDGDGAIDRQEFQQGLMQLLRGSALLKSMEKWEPLLWKLVDEDGSGFVSPTELNMAFSVREFMSI